MRILALPLPRCVTRGCHVTSLGLGFLIYNMGTTPPSQVVLRLGQDGERTALRCVCHMTDCLSAQRIVTGYLSPRKSHGGGFPAKIKEEASND